MRKIIDFLIILAVLIVAGYFLAKGFSTTFGAFLSQYF